MRLIQSDTHPIVGREISGWRGPISARLGGGWPMSDQDETPALPEAVMREVPKGALALSALTVGLLVVAWFVLYLFVFLPRGSAG